MERGSGHEAADGGAKAGGPELGGGVLGVGRDAPGEDEGGAAKGLSCRGHPHGVEQGLGGDGGRGGDVLAEQGEEALHVRELVGAGRDLRPAAVADALDLVEHVRGAVLDRVEEVAEDSDVVALVVGYW